MTASKADIIARLQKEILPLQGYRAAASGEVHELGLGAISHAFPGKSFPISAIHEFCCDTPEGTAATNGFVAVLLSSLMKKGGAVVWISSKRTVFPPALHHFKIPPHNIIFIDLPRARDLLWVTEEALKTEGLSAVIAEIPELDFTASRRFQLAVEHSHVCGLMLRINQRKPGTTAAIARWNIQPLASVSAEGLPGVAFPRWNVQLVKVRNGKPASWTVEYAQGRLKQVNPLTIIHTDRHKKTG